LESGEPSLEKGGDGAEICFTEGAYVLGGFYEEFCEAFFELVSAEFVEV
jgi:hypothetical protein